METTIRCASYPVGIPVGPVVRRGGWEEPVRDDGAPGAVVVVVHGGEAAADGESVAAEEDEQEDEGPPHEVDGAGYVGPVGRVLDAVAPGEGRDHQVDHVAVDGRRFSIPIDWRYLYVKYVVVGVSIGAGVAMLVVILVAIIS